MTTTRLTAIPDGVTAGDTVAVTLSLSDYPSPTWSLSWRLAGPSTLDVSSVANAGAHDLDVSSSESAALAAGLYQWRLRATDGVETITVQRGVLTCVADLGQFGDGEAVSWEVQALEVLQCSIVGSLEANMADFMIDGRRVTEIPLSERMALIGVLESRIAVQSGQGFGATVRFSYRGAMA